MLLFGYIKVKQYISIIMSFLPKIRYFFEKKPYMPKCAQQRSVILGFSRRYTGVLKTPSSDKI